MQLAHHYLPFHHQHISLVPVLINWIFVFVVSFSSYICNYKAKKPAYLKSLAMQSITSASMTEVYIELHLSN